MGFREVFALATAVMIGVAGCSSGEEIDAAANQVERFHAKFNAGSFPDIYARSSPEFRAAGGEAEFVRFMAATRKKLGPVKSAERQGFNVNYGTEGTVVTLSYKTRFAAGSGVEEFVYRGSGADKKLVGYHINSNELVTN